MVPCHLLQQPYIFWPNRLQLAAGITKLLNNLRSEKHQHCWMAASTCSKEAALNNKHHHYKVNWTQSIFFFHLSFPVVSWFSLPSSLNLAPYFSVFKMKICQSSQDKEVGNHCINEGDTNKTFIYVHTYTLCMNVRDPKAHKNHFSEQNKNSLPWKLFNSYLHQFLNHYC